jgi:uridine kinase
MITIGVCGGTGSGKTTFVKKITSLFTKEECISLSLDSYYKDTSNVSFEAKSKINFDHPNAIDFDLLIQNLIDLKKGKIIKQPVYSFKVHNRTKKSIKIEPKKVIFVEGILAYSNKELLKLFDLKIFIDIEEAVRLQRRIVRDAIERGRDESEVRERFINNSKPMYDKFIAPTKEYADYIITNETFNGKTIGMIYDIIRQKL